MRLFAVQEEVPELIAVNRFGTGWLKETLTQKVIIIKNVPERKVRFILMFLLMSLLMSLLMFLLMFLLMSLLMSLLMLL